MAYDDKFKRRVIQYKDNGHTFSEVSFGIRSQRYYVWKKQLTENGAFTRNYPATHEGKIDPIKLKGLVDEHPDWYLSEFAEVFGVWPQPVQKRFAKMAVTRKKNFHLQREVRRKTGSVSETNR